MVTQLGIGFGVTLGSILILAKVAPALQLLDVPNTRKLHNAPVPVVGGIALFIALCVAVLIHNQQLGIGLPPSLINTDINYTLGVFLTGCAIMVVTGALDDRFQLGVFVRILSEVAVALLLMETLRLHLDNIGDLFGNGPIRLHPVVGYPLGVVLVVGVINAYNMFDGLDGLAASLTLCTLVAFRMVSDHPPGLLGMTYAGALVAFLAANLQLIPRVPKVFLGDAGSKLLGFTVVALLLSASTTKINAQVMPKVTALFVVGLPLYDMAYVTLRRLARGESPFKPDRSHFHHLLLRFGASPRRTLAVITLFQGFFAFTGWLLVQANVAHHLQFSFYIGGFCLYATLVHHAWLAVERFEQMQPAAQTTSQESN